MRSLVALIAFPLVRLPAPAKQPFAHFSRIPEIFVCIILCSIRRCHLLVAAVRRRSARILLAALHSHTKRSSLYQLVQHRYISTRAAGHDLPCRPYTSYSLSPAPHLFIKHDGDLAQLERHGARSPRRLPDGRVGLLPHARAAQDQQADRVGEPRDSEAGIDCRPHVPVRCNSSLSKPMHELD